MRDRLQRQRFGQARVLSRSAKRRIVAVSATIFSTSLSGQCRPFKPLAQTRHAARQHFLGTARTQRTAQGHQATAAGISPETDARGGTCLPHVESTPFENTSSRWIWALAAPAVPVDLD